MHILRYTRPGSAQPHVGILAGPAITELDSVSSLGALWSLPVIQLRQMLETAASRGGPGGLDPGQVTLLAPVDGRTEVWACGVTYQISSQARQDESEHEADIYRRVYDAQRPELFFKSAAWRVAGTGQPVAVRADSAVSVPEPEVALIVTSAGEIAGYTVCNDVSSRSIEGENPLYLPQAKSYLGACALGPMIRPAWEIADPYGLGIEMTIRRDGTPVWSGTASTAQLNRRYGELTAALMHSDIHPEGAVLSTGTCLVPPLPFTLEQGHTVTISVEQVGTLENPVVCGLSAIAGALAPPAAAQPGAGAS